jgi:hypothetical protein
MRNFSQRIKFARKNIEIRTKYEIVLSKKFLVDFIATATYSPRTSMVTSPLLTVVEFLVPSQV